MSDSFTFIMAVAGTWLAIGLGLSWVMGSRGHAGFSWLVVGTVLGPLALVLAVDASRHDEALNPRSVPHRATRKRSGVVDVLVGYDGSDESRAAVDAAATLLGDRLGRLTVAAVVPYDAPAEHHRLTEAGLQWFARGPGSATKLVTDLMLLHGRPAQALRDLAADAGYGLIAVGARGAGVSRLVLGSTADELARGGNVPVLVAGGSPCGPQADEGDRLAEGDRVQEDVR